MTRLWGTFRILVAIAAGASVAVLCDTTLQDAAARGLPLGAELANFFSLFTIVGAVGSGTVLLISGVTTVRHPRRREPYPLTVALTAATAWMVLTGVVFQVLLRADWPRPTSTLEYLATEALHIALPVVLALDALVGPRRPRLRFSAIGWILAVPLAWCAYTLVRGPLVASPDGSSDSWYPYPFLDPAGPGGYGTVLVYVGIILAALIVLATILVLITRLRARR